MSADHLPRRGFLRGLGLVSLPLIGGGVTLIGKPAATVPLLQAAAAPMLSDPRERARYAWEAFSAAMREITADADGWLVMGAGERKPFGHLPGGSFLTLKSVHYRPGNEPQAPLLIVEKWRDIDLASGDA